MNWKLLGMVLAGIIILSSVGLVVGYQVKKAEVESSYKEIFTNCKQADRSPDPRIVEFDEEFEEFNKTIHEELSQYEAELSELEGGATNPTLQQQERIEVLNRLINARQQDIQRGESYYLVERERRVGKDFTEQIAACEQQGGCFRECGGCNNPAPTISFQHYLASLLPSEPVICLTVCVPYCMQAPN